MDKLDDAVDNFVQRLETAIAPGLSFKQFVTVEQSIEESVTLELGDSALDHFIHKKFRDQLASHRVRLQQECEKRYHSRCQKAHKLLFEGGGASDLRQDVFLHLSEYAKDPSRVERDWDQWSLRFLSLCGHGESSLSSQEESLNSNVDSSSQGEGERQVQVQVPGEESRVLLEVLKSAAVQLVANVNSEAAQQVAVHKQALLKVHEQLDQSSLDIIRLQGDKETNLAVCRSLESRVLELQNQQSTHADVVRALHTQLSLSELDAKKRHQECDTSDLKCAQLVKRLVAKTKEVSALTADAALLVSENDSFKRQQRHESGGSKKGKKSASSGGGDEVAMLQDLNVTYSRQVLELQKQLDATCAELESSRDAEECMAKLMRGDQEKLQHLQQELDSTGRQLSTSVSQCSQLEGKLNSREEECASRETHLATAQRSHGTALRELHEQHAVQDQEQASRISLLQNQIEASRRELEASAERLQGSEEAVQRLETRCAEVTQELVVAQTQAQLHVQAQSARGTAISAQNESAVSQYDTLKEELSVAQQDLVSSRAALRSEQEAHKHKERETRQQTQQRVQELDLAYFRVEAELRMKTTEAKKHFGAVKELEEETSALDRLRRKAELKLDEETQKRLVGETNQKALQSDLTAQKEAMRQSVEALEALQRDHAMMGVTQEAAVEDLAVLLDKAAESKEVIASLRLGVSEKNDLEYALSEMAREKEQLGRQVVALEAEVASLSPLVATVTRLEAEVRQLQSQAEQVATTALATTQKELHCQEVLTQFEEVSNLNTMLVAESVELEGQLETLSVAFEQRGELLGDLERRVDVASSDAAYLRGDNATGREQIRELGEKVQTLMNNYNEASEQNEEKGFALLQLNGQQHELQSNLSQLAGELSNLRDLPAQLSKLQEEHTRVSKQLTETLATLDELSLLSATEIEQKDAVLLELQMKLDEAVEANKVQSAAHSDLVAAHSLLAADREALFAAYSVLDNKLSHLEAEIME